MINLKNVTKKFGAVSVLDCVNLDIDDAKKVFIIGQNGAGKTTLMKTILGEILLNSGEVLINGVNPAKNRKKALSYISFVPQNPPPLKLSVGELCDYSISSSGSNLDDIKTYLKALNLDFDKEDKKPFHKLSGGMKQKILIAIALARNGDILMFDEPTANLDPEARECFLNLLSDKFKEKTIIFISHRLSEVRGIVECVVEMDLGRITSIKDLSKEDR
ncbi:TPA: ABC transporter ATP-binding protein [Campylobacter fetus]|nr:ABC transporter ATP-binding protein [Campylobacter fetus]